MTGQTGRTNTNTHLSEIQIMQIFVGPGHKLFKDSWLIRFESDIEIFFNVV